MEAFGWSSIVHANDNALALIGYAKAGSEREMPACRCLAFRVKMLTRRGDGAAFSPIPGRTAGLGMAGRYRAKPRRCDDCDSQDARPLRILVGDRQDLIFEPTGIDVVAAGVQMDAISADIPIRVSRSGWRALIAGSNEEWRRVVGGC